MRPATKSFLKSFNACPLFINVGKATELVPEPSVGSWKVAAKKCSTKEWNYIQIDRSNILTSYLASVDMSAYRKWNKIVQSLYAEYKPHVESEVTRVIGDVTLRKAVIGSVNWDTLGACMELEYASHQPPRFFDRLAAIYLDGHFPCGWQGKYPNAGGLLIY